MLQKLAHVSVCYDYYNKYSLSQNDYRFVHLCVCVFYGGWCVWRGLGGGRLRHRVFFFLFQDPLVPVHPWGGSESSPSTRARGRTTAAASSRTSATAPTSCAASKIVRMGRDEGSPTATKARAAFFFSGYPVMRVAVSFYNASSNGMQ